MGQAARFSKTGRSGVVEVVGDMNNNNTASVLLLTPLGTLI